MTVVLDELQQLQPKTLTDPELGTGKHLTVFLRGWDAKHTGGPA